MKHKIIGLLAAQIEGMSKEDGSATIEIPLNHELEEVAVS